MFQLLRAKLLFDIVALQRVDKHHGLSGVTFELNLSSDKLSVLKYYKKKNIIESIIHYYSSDKFYRWVFFLKTLYFSLLCCSTVPFSSRPLPIFAYKASKQSKDSTFAFCLGNVVFRVDLTCNTSLCYYYSHDKYEQSTCPRDVWRICSFCINRSTNMLRYKLVRIY